MAAFSNSDIKNLRKSLKITAAELAERISIDPSTLYKYESGKIKLSIDVMYQICEALGCIEKWTEWMITEYPASYGKVNAKSGNEELSMAVLLMSIAMSDVESLQQEVLKNCVKGKTDSALNDKLNTALDELILNAQKLKEIISKL